MVVSAGTEGTLFVLDALRQELRAHYQARSCFGKPGGYRSPLWEELDAYAAARPEASPIQLKAFQYDLIAERFEPTLLANSPFYFEMGIKAAEGDGEPSTCAGGWLFRRNSHLFRDHGPEDYDQYQAASRLGLHLSYNYPDVDHHTCSYASILRQGLCSFHAKAEAALADCEDSSEREFLDAACRGLLAIRRIGEKFSEAAEQLFTENPPQPERAFLEMVATTAKEVPWRAPRTFYEGLAALWFLHETQGALDGVRIYVLGRLDLLLGPLLEQDLARGTVSRDEAYDLLCRYLLHLDCKLDLTVPVETSYNRQELGGTLILGGCDEAGNEVCNDLTFMVLQAHRELDLLYPKLHCRVSRNSSREYLDAIDRSLLAGRNVLSFLNDDAIIPAQVRAGKRLEDARNYVAGGCWEVIVEGCEHSAGANCYFSLARVMDLSIHPSQDVELATGDRFDPLDDATDFESVYQITTGNAIRAIRRMCMLIGEHGSVWPAVNPSPLFSACLADCLENRQDYTMGGGRYNPHALPLAGFAIFVDSLLVIRELCFGSGRHTLAELLQAVRENWEGHDALRAEALGSPFFGDGGEESSTLARRVLGALGAGLVGLRNERGGPFALGLYNYRDVVDWAPLTRATPDGRRTGDFLSQGLTPSRLRPSTGLTSVLRSVAALDLGQCPANTVLTLSVPLGDQSLTSLGHLARAFVLSGAGMLQPNCVDTRQLLDAQLHPEQHRDLVVRLYGYSARFVNLTAEMQKEFIGRQVHA
jgi:formate C-acetyltransferase